MNSLSIVDQLNKILRFPVYTAIKGIAIMPIKTSTFGGAMITGDAAKAFKKQFIDNDVPASKLAQESLDRGRKTLKTFLKDGFVKLPMRQAK